MFTVILIFVVNPPAAIKGDWDFRPQIAWETGDIGPRVSEQSWFGPSIRMPAKQRKQLRCCFWTRTEVINPSSSLQSWDKRLVNVCDQVIRILDTDGQPQKTVCDTQLRALFIGQLRVGRGHRCANNGFNTTKAECWYY